MSDYFYIPENLNLAFLLFFIGDRDWHKPEHWARYYYLIDHIYITRLFNKLGRDKYIPINAEVLERVLNSRWAGVVKFNLVRMGILEAKLNEAGRETFEVGVESKSYRFTEQYSHKTFRRVKVENQILLRRMALLRSRYNDRAVQNNDGRALIRRSVENLTYDWEAALKFVGAQSYKSSESENKRIAVIECFKERKFSCGPDKPGRFYHIMTKCPRDIRKFATFRGKGLVEIDVTDCQPALHASLYPGYSAEKEKYIEVVASGRFKEFINQRLNVRCDLLDPEQKKKFKEDLFHYVFFGSPYDDKKELFEIFNREFPILFQRIKEQKKYNNLRDLPVSMQNLEAAITIDIVASRLAKAHQRDENFCLITIHDCFLTTEEYSEEVKEAYLKGFEERVGFKCSVKVKRISEDSKGMPPESQPLVSGAIHSMVETSFTE